MALIEPDWLRSWLDSLNWDILSFHIYVGDAIENAIDWVLDWLNAIIEWAGDIGAWWEDFRQEVVDLFTIITEELALFFADPVGYIKDIFVTAILPWLEENIPWVITIVDWVVNFGKELELFFSDPGDYIREWFEVTVLPWAEEHVPWIITIIEWVNNFKDELELFFSDPVGYIHDKLETSEWGDLFTAWEDFKEGFMAFFTDPVEWLWLQFSDWFLGKEE